MDQRRPPRTVIDPKVRQVGFVAPAVAAVPPARSQSAPIEDVAASGALASSPPSVELPLSGGSLSPVMIPPPRHASLDAGRPPAPLPLSPSRRDVHQISVGSYNPSEMLLETPSGLSPSSSPLDEVGTEFSDESSASTWLGKNGAGKVASSLPAGSGEMMVMKPSASTATGAGMNHPPRSSLTIASMVKTLPGMPGKDRVVIGIQNEGHGTSKEKPKSTKAERRAIQESQRAAKAAAKEAGGGQKHLTPATSTSALGTEHVKVIKPQQKKDGSQEKPLAGPSEKKVVERPSEKERKKDVPHPRLQYDDEHRVEKAKRRAVFNQSEARNRVELFRHLPQYIHGSQLPDLESKIFQLELVHPSVYKVGLQYLSGDISGGNARCTAMLLAFREAIGDYSTPPQKVLVRDLTAKISSYVSFLIECRPLSISMGNAIKFLKSRIAKLPLTLSELEAKVSLQSDIDRFINEKIVIADKVIVRHAVNKIRNGDVLLTYGSSSVIEMVLLYAHELGKKFRLIIVDSRPKLEGQALLRKLVERGLNCTYTHINAISYIMHEVSRVFLGAASVLSNGTVYSRVGTACVAMVAHAFQVPVLVCCEAYKFHERVQLDSICSNELGDPDVISKVHGRKDLNHLDNWAEKENLQLLNLTYDATPSDYVSMIITDYGMIPPTSVPVIVREYRREHIWI